MRTVTKRYIGGELVESHGREVTESVNPSNGELQAVGHRSGVRCLRDRGVPRAEGAFPARFWKLGPTTNG